MKRRKKARLYQREAIDKFLATLPTDAALRTIVHGAQVQDKLAAFEIADAEALRHQNRYRRSGRVALWATTVGTLIGALLLLPLDRWIVGLPRGAIGVLQTLALIVTFLAIQWIGWRRPVDKWMVNRAEAERSRGAIFQAAIEAPAPPGAPAPDLAKDKLGLLIAAHIEDQLGYFKRGEQRHTKAAGRLTPFRLVGYLLTGVAVGLGATAMLQLAATLGLVLPVGVQRLADWLVTTDAGRWQLGLGTMASSLLAHAGARSMMDQDERNAALYARTATKVREALAARAGGVAHLDRVRAAASGDEAALRAFFLDMRRILEQEHVAWFLSRPPSDPV